MIRIVEDDPDLARMLEVILTSEGRDCVVTTRDFDWLLTPDQWGRITVAMVDLMLGEPTTGKDILDYLHDHHPHIRRVVLSAAADHVDVHHAHAVLTKPATIEQITEALGE